MVRRISLFLSCVVLAACSANGDFKNPFVKDRPFAPSAVPADFAIVVDEGHFTYTIRQHVQQVITAADATSRTTYTNYQELNDAVRDRYTTATTLTPSQLQDLWNEVSRKNLMEGSTVWINAKSDADWYKKNEYTIQIHANGRTRTYRQANGFSGSTRDLMLMLQGVRLPSSQGSQTPVVGAEPTTAPASEPATIPTSMPATSTAPATQP
ncbi:MAG TPA: hypothetical protein VHM90_11340 [Phycisphaerae bacterium]|jgi:hypothetical protein|nr:hypothetical protein [Phycisphaerae bacterium]